MTAAQGVGTAYVPIDQQCPAKPSVKEEPRCFTGLRDDDLLVVTIHEVSAGSYIDNFPDYTPEFAIDLSYKAPGWGRAATLCQTVHEVETGVTKSSPTVHKIHGREINDLVRRYHDGTSPFKLKIDFYETDPGATIFSIVPAIIAIFTFSPGLLSPGIFAEHALKDTELALPMVDVSQAYELLAGQHQYQKAPPRTKISFHVERNHLPDWRSHFPIGRGLSSLCHRFI